MITGPNFGGRSLGLSWRWDIALLTAGGTSIFTFTVIFPLIVPRAVSVGSEFEERNDGVVHRITYFLLISNVLRDSIPVRCRLRVFSYPDETQLHVASEENVRWFRENSKDKLVFLIRDYGIQGAVASSGNLESAFPPDSSFFLEISLCLPFTSIAIWSGYYLVDGYADGANRLQVRAWPSPRTNMLRFLKSQGALSKYSTQDVLKKIELYWKEHHTTIGLSFAGENLAGIDLGQSTIQRELRNGRYPEQNPPPWYSGESRKESLLKTARVIAAEREPSGIEIAIKRGINLEGVDFSDTDLTCADLEGADLAQANLRGAALNYANLYWTRLWDSNFVESSLDYAVLTRSAMQNADFTRAKMTGAIFDRCLLYRVRFEHTELTGEQIPVVWEERTAKKIAKGFLFTMDARLETEIDNLDNRCLSDIVRNEFEKEGYQLSNPKVEVTRSKSTWTVSDGQRDFFLKVENNYLDVWSKGSQKKNPHTHYSDAAAAYNGLKNNFVTIGRHDDAAQAFIKQKRIERLARGLFSPIRIQNLLFDILCGYGERPARVFAWAFGTVALFGVIYSLPWFDKGDLNSTVDYWVFSLTSFVTLTFQGLNDVPVGLRILSSLEAGIGVSFLSLFVYSLSRRLRAYPKTPDARKVIQAQAKCSIAT